MRTVHRGRHGRNGLLPCDKKRHDKRIEEHEIPEGNKRQQPGQLGRVYFRILCMCPCFLRLFPCFLVLGLVPGGSRNRAEEPASGPKVQHAALAFACFVCLFLRLPVFCGSACIFRCCPAVFQDVLFFVVTHIFLCCSARLFLCCPPDRRTASFSRQAGCRTYAKVKNLPDFQSTDRGLEIQNLWINKQK